MVLPFFYPPAIPSPLFLKEMARFPYPRPCYPPQYIKEPLDRNALLLSKGGKIIGFEDTLMPSNQGGDLDPISTYTYSFLHPNGANVMLLLRRECQCPGFRIPQISS